MKAKLAIWIIAICTLTACYVGNVCAQPPQSFAVNNGSPLADARPGDYFYLEGVKAVRANDYRHAVYEYKIAASWAHKVAQYNLAVIFYNGEGGLNHDIPQALAWMMLAAERDDGSNQHKKYARDLERMIAASEDYEVARAKELLKVMSLTYADEHAMPRAKLRWQNVRMNVTGSHAGSIGNLSVSSSNMRFKNPERQAGSRAAPGMSTAAELTGGSGTDGSIAYAELRATDNPYDATWDTGTVTVGDIETVSKAGSKPQAADSKKQ